MTTPNGLHINVHADTDAHANALAMGRLARRGDKNQIAKFLKGRNCFIGISASHEGHTVEV